MHNVVSGAGGNVVQVNSLTGDVNIMSGAGKAVPKQLPASPWPFVNRRKELADLDARLIARGTDAAWLGVVSGLGGVGKTATVLRWANAVASQFPDGQLYVDYAALRTESGTAVGDALADCLRGLGVQDDHIPGSSSGRLGLFRTKIAGRRCLIVLDDVTEPAQVLPFLPNAPGSAVVVTSNDRLVDLQLNGADPIMLQPLRPDDGVRMLQELCGEQRVLAERETARELVRLCAGLPIALRVASARLVASPRLRIGDLVSELADESRRLHGFARRGERLVSAVFDNVYRNLPGEAAMVYRRLGCVPCLDITWDVAEIAAMGVGGVDDAVQRLIEANLLNEVEGDRLRFHDLVRLHARECAARDEPAEVEASIVRAVAGHYLPRAVFADLATMNPNRLRIADPTALTEGLTDPFNGSSVKAAKWQVRERANLLHVLRAVADRGWHETAWQLAEALVPLYLNQRYLADWVESSELGAVAARLASNPAAEARLRSLVSRAYTDLGELTRAKEELHTAKELAHESGNLVLVASVWEFTGRYLDKVNPAGAVDAYRQAIEVNTAAKEWRGVALVTYFLGRALHASGDHAGALPLLTEAHETLTGMGDQRMAARALLSLGVARAKAGETEAARDALGAAADVLEQRGAVIYEAEARQALAGVLERTGDLDGARAQLRRVLEIHEKGGADVTDLVARLARLSPGAP
ncbi:NB-ARC domain-containing protein [Actinokineospora iranica]|uniref:NB-ARC domain-containing protein n=1 Tax=Actinokineospora iranica TaxID=1271860 RepID=A0A1G6Z3J1_9PSEU|nr:NB-ARC domain-containing protein [Actinokineospora iranica]SDD97200.1 NB-ARC domain-containing protein [Actinokineospora iranica]